MSQSRLTLALEAGAVALPQAGRILVIGPTADADLSALPKERVQIVQGFAPDHAAWAARGWQVDIAAQGDFAAALVFVPRAKAVARARVEQALRLTGGGPVIVDGAKTDGVDSLLRAARKTGAELSEAFAKAHGKTFAMQGDPAAFADWVPGPGALIDGRYRTAPGVFSADDVDRGSALLLAALPPKLKGRVADLGAGWGYLAGEALAAHPGIKEMHLVEADHAALDCARANVSDPRASFHWADATAFRSETRFDIVLTNPPFHTARAADPALGQAFLMSAAGLLAPHGVAYVVANRHLPYERDLDRLFTKVEEIGGDPGFKVLRASHPRRGVRGPGAGRPG
ncbi:class I SAM-dependent methyltransferase [Rhodovulum adriaticum]|uniref:16S rRNA m(2)G 1207 methyltransferase n=1 Tax=Rhodovulum adriaticum TaxID=35804 RepID=A0A4R2NHN7_RHOAD|nr:methyltransferase [Rhodovulum adriaticum]MBK1637162.1 MFS transporter [Rhodovulum adriaticum]TCP20943.1 16S rRNA m(2)G 1207 methyltransferase [Rhodovulum adriaticum]